jgi:hypothetical protein
MRVTSPKDLLRACAALAIVLCAVLCCSCAGPRHAAHDARGAEPSGKPLGHSGCGPPITYEIFQKGAFGVDWSKAGDLIAFNTKGSDGLYHVYTVKPDGSSRQQLGIDSPSFPQRTTGTPVWSPSGRFIAFVAEKSAHPEIRWALRPVGAAIPTCGWPPPTDRGPGS